MDFRFNIYNFIKTQEMKTDILRLIENPKIVSHPSFADDCLLIHKLQDGRSIIKPMIYGRELFYYVQSKDLELTPKDT